MTAVDDRMFRRVAAWSAFAGIGIGLVSAACLVAAAWDVVGRIGLLALVEDQSRILEAGPDAAGLLRCGYLADMLGFYLLWLPLMVALHPRLAATLGSQAAGLATVSGLLYVALGSLGAVLLGTLLPDLVAAPAGAPSGVLARNLVEAVHRGVWQTLDAITGGVWLLLCGEAFRRSGKRLLGWGGIASGSMSLLLALGWILELPVLVLVGLVFLAFVVLWIAGVARELLHDA